MSEDFFTEQTVAWSHPPVDGVGYLDSSELLLLPDEELVDLVARMERERYEGWRNTNGRWRDVLGLDSTSDKIVLDYGCGVGVEALQYARGGNTLHLSDIAPTNVELASRVLRLHGFKDFSRHTLSAHRPRARIPLGGIDVVHCCGVLHHIPYAKDVVEEMAGWLRPQGELRLMVYSDVSWTRATGTPPPPDVTQHARFEQYVLEMDAVGRYADWYDCTKLLERFGRWFDVERCEYLDETLFYLGAVLRRKR